MVVMVRLLRVGSELHVQDTPHDTVPLLEIVQELVDFYKPQIEQACKVCLGAFAVNDSPAYRLLMAKELRKSLANAEKTGEFVSGIDDATKERAIFKVVDAGCGSEALRYSEGIIYLGPKADELVEKKEGKVLVCPLLDVGVVHELSHRLWEVLRGQTIEQDLNELEKKGASLNKHRIYRMWNEGFATFCHDQVFVGLDERLQQVADLPLMYVEGANKVVRVLEKYGASHLTRIPRDWEQLSKEFE